MQKAILKPSRKRPVSCRSLVRGPKAEHIQTVEKYIRKVSEARISELECKVLEALNSGLKMTDLKITEVITWTDSIMEFGYSVKVEKK